MGLSAVDHGTRRDAIRETWGSNLKLYNSKLIFLLGQGRDKQSKIQNEHNLYNDILQEDFEVIFMINSFIKLSFIIQYRIWKCWGENWSNLPM